MGGVGEGVLEAVKELGLDGGGQAGGGAQGGAACGGRGGRGERVSVSLWKDRCWEGRRGRGVPAWRMADTPLRWRGARSPETHSL